VKQIVGTCEETAEAISAALDGPLPWYRRIRMRLHLWACRFCRRYEVQAKWLHAVCEHHCDELADIAGDTEDLTLTAEEREELQARLGGR